MKILSLILILAFSNVGVAASNEAGATLYGLATLYSTAWVPQRFENPPVIKESIFDSARYQSDSWSDGPEYSCKFSRLPKNERLPKDESPINVISSDLTELQNQYQVSENQGPSCERSVYFGPHGPVHNCDPRPHYIEKRIYIDKQKQHYISYCEIYYLQGEAKYGLGGSTNPW